MTRSNKKKSTSQQLQKEIQNAFSQFEDEDTSKMSRDDIPAALEALGLEISNNILTAIKQDHLDFEDFVKLVDEVKFASNFDKELRKVFELFDSGKKGKVNWKDVKRICEELNEPLTDDEVKEMIELGDKDNDGFITFEDFKRIMRKTSFG